MSQLIMNAVMAEAAAKEAKALANLQNYMSSPVGVGEHPDVVAEVSKLMNTLSEARGVIKTINGLLEQSSKNQSKEE